MTIHPGLNPRSLRHDAQLVPAFGDEVRMTFIDLLLRRQPARAERFAVEHALWSAIPYRIAGSPPAAHSLFRRA